MPEVSFAPGTVLADRYQIQQILGKKTGRRTLLAQDLLDQTPVILKLLLFNNDFEWDDLKLFEREAETLQSLAHSAIPRYLNHFELDLPLGKGFALVQSYLEARSLEEHLQAGRSFSEIDLKQIATALLEILTYLHRQKPPVIHRDIKPSNILLSVDGASSTQSVTQIGQVYLVDFGSVQTLAARGGGTMTIVGTYGYMPPEQFGERAVPASDLYSLGATLIYLATGQHPADLPQRNLRIQFESIAQLKPQLTRWLKQMTDPDLSHRFASAAAALAALQQPSDRLSDRASADLRLVTNQPVGSRVKLSQDSETIEIILPSPLVTSSASLIFWLALRGLGIWILLHGWGVNALTILFTWLLGGPILQSLCQKRLQIDSQYITLRHECLGIPYRQYKASRKTLCKLVLTRRYYQVKATNTTHTRNTPTHVEVKPRLVLWAGTRAFELGDPLTSPELDWLARELSEWLGLKLTQE
ncbi:serine/threonine protein kinase [Phormidium tenue FACHB-886]|nr:serine/threonine protein kinase [Phormidium tenue FACHB-886]